MLEADNLALQSMKNWTRKKKYWTLFLVSAFALVNSFGENVQGASWTTIGHDGNVSMTNMNGGSAVNYLLLGIFNLIWVPVAMLFGRKIVFIISLILVGAGDAWQGRFYGTTQFYLSCTISGMGTAAYEALVQLTVCSLRFTRVWWDLTAYTRGRSLMSSSTMSVVGCSPSTCSVCNWVLFLD